MKKIALVSFYLFIFTACQDAKDSKQDKTDKKQTSTVKNQITEPEIIPVNHASFVVKWNDKIWFNDPVGSAELYSNYPTPDIILISDIHGDHLSLETLEALEGDFKIIAPETVFEQLSDELKERTTVLKNEESLVENEFTITAIPMYNITEERLQNHPKGRGNGYVIDSGSFRLYISGDTENIPEMKDLQGIDLALVCMNLPYTMSIEQAADGVAAFAPKTVIPYHYRGLKDGERHIYDTKLFERYVDSYHADIKVKHMDFYPETNR